MCTAATYQTNDFYFGRTLDYEFNYECEVTVMPKNYPLVFRHIETWEHHYAMIGMAYVQQDYPLFYDAVNEQGLGMAGLNFVGNAKFATVKAGQDNIAAFELIPWILGQCATVEEARQQIARMNVTRDAFSQELPPAQLHWLISDRKENITLEVVAGGIQVYDNPVGILTNNPPFPQQLFQLNNYRMLSPENSKNLFSKQLSLDSYSRGMGALGLPGDLSSGSRFVRAAFVKLNSISGDSETESVSQFFHILGSVDQQRGCCSVGNGEYEITYYTSCCNASQGIYYYTTYDNHQITAVDMHQVDLKGKNLTRYPLIKEEQIYRQN